MRQQPSETRYMQTSSLGQASHYSQASSSLQDDHGHQQSNRAETRMAHQRYTRAWIKFLPQALLHKVLFRKRQTLGSHHLPKTCHIRMYPRNIP
jgi:hypothetical protein